MFGFLCLLILMNFALFIQEKICNYDSKADAIILLAKYFLNNFINIKMINLVYDIHVTTSLLKMIFQNKIRIQPFRKF